MRFGIFDHLDDGGVPLGRLFEERLKLIEAYDRAGFYGYHLAEHHNTPLGYAPSPGVFLAAVAQRTRRLRFGPMVYLLPLYHPLRLIDEICMLDQMSSGRFLFGVGRGVSPIEVGFFGADLARGMQQFAEALEVVRLGLTCDALTYNGEFYKFDSVPMALKPLQRPHPPLWYGISRPETVSWAVTNDVNIVTRLCETRPLTDAYRAEWKARGKSEAELPLLGQIRHIVLADSEAEARRIAQRAYRQWRRHMEFLWRQKGVPFPLHGVLPDEFGTLARSGYAFAGTPAGARRYIAEQAEAGGVNYLVCGFVFGDITLGEAMHSVELFANEVMPAFADARPTPVVRESRYASEFSTIATTAAAARPPLRGAAEVNRSL
jgi:alkanesulfonate monooxygenase SsuD/methylene tetrahydromethanopterin reductase-like flavin-dependent oxidoreductase (luciferase family)